MRFVKNIFREKRVKIALKCQHRPSSDDKLVAEICGFKYYICSNCNVFYHKETGEMRGFAGRGYWNWNIDHPTLEDELLLVGVFPE